MFAAMTLRGAMSPPFGVIGSPVAVTMYAISGLVDSVPVSE